MEERSPQKPFWPPLFVEIVKNQEARKPLYARLLIRLDEENITVHPPSPEEWKELKRLFREMQQLRKAAQALLNWNASGSNNPMAAAMGAKRR